MRQAVLYKKLTKQMVECQACSWHCKITPEQTGICGVRKNIGGELYLMVYGHPVSVNIDPIEKKPLYHFLPGSKIFSLGTVGCNFGCLFCQNFDISQITKVKEEAKNYFADLEEEELTPKKIVDFCLEKKIPSIAFTYNEPVIFAEYAVEVMKLAKQHNIYGVFVSNGYESKESLDYLDNYIDAYNIDLKSFDPEFYKSICKAKLEPVLENIKEIYRRGKWLEVTTLVIPGKNDSAEELKDIVSFLKNISSNIPWHVSAFYPTYKMLEVPATPEETLFRAYNIGKKVGLNYIYTGNIQDSRYNNTLCPKCNTLIIERDAFYHTKAHSNDGICPKCHNKITGIWK